MKITRILKWIGSAIALLVLFGVAALFVAYWRSGNDCGQVGEVHNPMKAIVYCDYGGPDVLKLENISTPVPKGDQVLIRVQAAAVNPYDWHFLRGIPYVMRLETGLRKPKSRRFGVDAAGQIAAVGKDVTQFKPGDEVFGACNGSLAEYCIAKTKLALKPANVTFAQAAAVPEPHHPLAPTKNLRHLGPRPPPQKRPDRSQASVAALVGRGLHRHE